MAQLMYYILTPLTFFMGICDKVGSAASRGEFPIPCAHSQKVFSFRVGMLTISSRKRVFVFMNCKCVVAFPSQRKSPHFRPKNAGCGESQEKNSCTNSSLPWQGKVSCIEKLVKTYCALAGVQHAKASPRKMKRRIE